LASIKIDLPSPPKIEIEEPLFNVEKQNKHRVQSARHD